MNKIQKRRLTYVLFFLAGIALAASLIFFALRQNLNVFVTPSDLAARANNTNIGLRLGGMVKKSSVKRDTSSLQVDFIITDFKHDIPFVIPAFCQISFMKTKA